MDTNDTRGRRRRAAGLVAAGLVGGVVLAGFATANAQTDPTPSPSQTAPGTPGAPAPRGPMDGGRGKHGGKHGMGMGIHGEFVTAAPGGGWQTIATQRGEVTAVSATSLTIRSEDGFSRTYSVDDNTLVNAGNEGIDDVENGDDVRVTALVVDGKYNAVQVNDGTQVERLHGRWRPAPPPLPNGTAPGTGTAPGATTPSSTGTA